MVSAEVGLIMARCRNTNSMHSEELMIITTVYHDVIAVCTMLNCLAKRMREQYFNHESYKPTDRYMEDLAFCLLWILKCDHPHLFIFLGTFSNHLIAGECSWPVEFP